MPKYAILGGYTPDAFKGMVDSPEARKDAIERAAKEVGATLEAWYWTFGEDDYLGIADAPDDVTAAAISVGFSASGRLRNLRTIKLMTTDDIINVLGKAKTVAAAYAPPGARQPVGVS